MTTVTSQIDALHAAHLAERLRSVVTRAEPALEPDELETLTETAAYLDETAGVQRCERRMQSPATGETYVVHKWIDLGDGCVTALAKEPAEDSEEAGGDD
jgi:hypothetical protein